MSSMRPTNGLTKDAPARAASSAWLAEKTRVTFVRMPSFFRPLTAFMPSGVIGTLTTTCGSRPARTCPSAIIPSASSASTSAEIGPSTMEAISLMTAWKSFPSLAIRDGFVVTPEMNPMSLALRMASTSAVSIKNSISFSFYLYNIFSMYSIFALIRRNVNNKRNACKNSILETGFHPGRYRRKCRKIQCFPAFFTMREQDLHFPSMMKRQAYTL